MTDIKRKQTLTTSWIVLALLFVAVYLVIWLLYIRPLQESLLRNSFVYLGVQALFFAGLYGYLLFSTNKVMYDLKRLGAFVTTFLISFALIVLFVQLFSLYYLAPYALCACVCAALFGNRTALVANVVMVMSFFAALLFFTDIYKGDLVFILFAGVFGCVFTTYSTREYNTRARQVLQAVILGAIYVAFAVVTYFAFDADFNAHDFIVNLLTAFGGGLLTVMSMFILVPLLERVFNQVTNFRLAELTNTNQPLLRRLLNEAPGTFNHSLTVSNYVEACASAIGVNPFAARAVAYYHDIGKLKNPLYFIENQSGHNPHDELSPEASVLALKKHVIYGLSLAKEYNLPQDICRGIIEHHGTLPIKYFYLKAKKLTDGDLPYDHYRYDGPKPSTKISAILMICDACEAALRAINDKSRAAETVHAIVDERMAFEQFTECDITMQELEIVKSTIISTYLGHKHERIAYPDVVLHN